ncbi:MAG: hypothetical protein AVDCRST_MAG64-438 [uncultured Phycisphaerae bacterium]|uniref:Uncharacterized protein n=1 Tax=uncultured Phycisphaerae bacterium TaxID=904963 RepID=A0A6J4N7S2_9BACT|nr:MAG: hypothetical protein AVDCRST_MAG64-438 [uncultured Phycisphaerae bacterium]
MRRRLFALTSAVSLGLCAAACVLWVTAQFVQRQWAWGSVVRLSPTELLRVDTGIGWDASGVAVKSLSQIARSSDPADMDYKLPRWKALPPHIDVDGRFGLGLRLDREFQPMLRSNSIRYFWRERSFRVRHVQLVLLSGVLPLLWASRRLPAHFGHERQRLTANLCPVCGYDLRATPDCCPECGSVSRSHPRKGKCQP